MATDAQQRHVGPPPKRLRGVPGGYCLDPEPHEGPHQFQAEGGWWTCMGVAPR